MADALVDRVARILDAHEWTATPDDDSPGGLLLDPREGSLDWPVVAQVGPDDGVVALYSVLPEQVPLEHRPAMVRLLAAANYELRIGSLEIDLDDGDVQVRTSLDLTGVDLDDAVLTGLLEKLIGANLEVMQVWLPALRAVAAGEDPDSVVD